MAVERQFFTTTTSILWLEQHVCYISFTGVVISEAEDVNKPSLTVISSQAFDDQWKEIEKDIGFIDEKFQIHYLRPSKESNRSMTLTRTVMMRPIM